MKIKFVKTYVAFILFSFISLAPFRFVYALPYSPITLSSAQSPQVKELKVITDNEDAFRNKVDLIRSARQSIKMMYYIYTQDETSSYLTQLLIDKAQKENVTVELLVDLSTNFLRWDLFEMMEKEGRGNIKVRFFNRPTPSVIRDVTFITSTCNPSLTESDCRSERRKQANLAYQAALNAQQNGQSTQLPVLTSAFLSGLYAKNGTTLKTAMALGTGKDIEEVKKLIESSSSDKMNESEFEQFKTLLKLIYEAKVKGSLMAKAQLAIALATHGEQVQPILDLFDKIVPDTMRDELANGDDWYHITDFLHHKFLLIDGVALQMGGRNIENSYHLNKKINSDESYIFRDTDVLLRFKSPQHQLAKTFDLLFQAKSITSTIEDIKTEMNFEYVAKIDFVSQKLIACMASNKENPVECLTKDLPSLLHTDQYRLQSAKENMQQKASSEDVKKALISSVQSDQFQGVFLNNELLNAQVQYLENIPYEQNANNNYAKRLYFQNGEEESSRQTKGIHNAVINGIRQVCRIANNRYRKATNREEYLKDSNNWERIIIHQGYVIFPAELLRILGQTVALSSVRGSESDLKCPGVKIDILTNSIATTDLSVINLFATHQIGTLIQTQEASAAYFKSIADPIVRGRMSPPAQIRYFELQPPQDTKKLESLHSKVFVLGNNRMIVGSANADVRSYYMDTNNAIDILNAPNFISSYIRWIDAQLKPDSQGNSKFQENTQNLLAATTAVARSVEESPELTHVARLKMLTQFYTVELNKFAQYFENKWRSKNENASSEEKEKLNKRIDKMYKYVPNLARVVAEINLSMYNLSQKIVKNDPDEGELKESGAFTREEWLQIQQNKLNQLFGWL